MSRRVAHISYKHGISRKETLTAYGVVMQRMIDMDR